MTTRAQGIVGVEAMDGGHVYVSYDGDLTALSVAWKGGVTSVEMARGQVALLVTALQRALGPPQPVTVPDVPRPVTPESPRRPPERNV